MIGHIKPTIRGVSAQGRAWDQRDLQILVALFGARRVFGQTSG